MRIVFITSKLNFTKSGGSIEEIDFIIRTLNRLGHEVTVVTAYSSANHIPDALPYRVIPEQIKSSGYLGIQREVFALLNKYSDQADWFHIDAHLFMYGAGLWRWLGGKVPVAAFFNQFLTCWSQYESSLFPRPAKSFLKKAKEKVRWYVERYLGIFLANHLDCFSFVSPTLRRMYEDFGLRTNEEKSLVIGDPIDFKKIMAENGITADSYALRNKHDGPVTFFYSSRMSPGKGFDIFLKGFSLVKNKDNFKVILGGTGPEEKYVRQMVKELGLEKYVEIPGWVTKEQLYNYYKTADIFIQADWWPAGTSISLLYALAFGLPSILPGGGGLQWNAKNSALYFKYRDCNELAEKIEELGGNYKLREELSRQCYARLADEDMNYAGRIKDLSEKMLALEQNKDKVGKSLKAAGKHKQWSYRALQLFGILFVLITGVATNKWFVSGRLATAPVYILLGIGGAVLCWWALYWQAENQKSLVLVFISVIFSLYLGEALLPVVTNRLNLVGYKVSDTYDSRSITQVVEDLRKNNIEVYPHVSDINTYKFKTTEWAVFPLGGIASKKIVFCQENGPFNIIENDEYGFNNPVGLQSGGQSPAVVLLGDSFTEGACVPFGQDVGSFLRQQGITALNLSRGGDGPLLELATLAEYAVYLKPKAVLWLYYEGNDLTDLQNELTYKELTPYLNDDAYSQQLRKFQPAIDKQLISALEEGMKADKKVGFVVSQLFERLTLVNVRGILSRVIRRFSGQDRSIEREQYSQEDALINVEFQAILSHAKKRVSSWGGTLYFVYLPSTLRYASSVDVTAFHRQRVLQMVERLKIPTIDFYQTLQEHKENWAEYFPYYPKMVQSHYAAPGYKLLSGILTEELKK